MDTTKSIGIQGKIFSARTERQNFAFENYLIRFFERELEVKLTRREMWRSVSFFARSLAFLEKNPHLCNDFHLKQATRFANKAVGIFYAYRLMLYKFRPVWSVNAPTACFRWKATGSGTFFVPSPCLYFIYSF
ncbi:hypothetical protein [Barnesiella intestinihominis]|uniref:hypothetical protein n=1 Tax=Barnesiella intestinihominis TaxID=487174 RepID=UPI002430E03B|nr:hypothetical protein [Barnesiella intestinihominis]